MGMVCLAQGCKRDHNLFVNRPIPVLSPLHPCISPFKISENF